MLTNEKTEATKISVIIPTLNAGQQFQLLLEKLQQQTIRPYELIIVDSSSEDNTIRYATDAGAKIVSVERSQFDHGGTRNFAASYATGDILLFMTQDVLPVDNKLLEHLAAPLMKDISSNGVAYCYARQIADESGHPLEKLARANNYPAESAIKSYDDIEQYGIKTFFCSNACSAIRREVFEEMGGFQSPVIFNEDMFMAAKCILSGMKIAYCADAMVYHTHRYTVKQQFKRFFDNGVSMRCNIWILPYASVTKAGSKLVIHQMKGLISEGHWLVIPKLLAESAAKLIGYKLGMNFTRLPSKLCRRFSMHKLIWDIIEHNGLQENQYIEEKHRQTYDA